MINCPKCNATLPDGALFCTQCGTSIEQAPPTNTTTQAETAAASTAANTAEQTAQTGAANNQNTFNGQATYQSAPQNGYQAGYQQQTQYTYAAPASNDHTHEFKTDDISKNKVIAMASYLLGSLGIIIALLAAPESPYASFHSRQALKLSIVNTLLVFLTIFLFWTILIPIASGICMLILFVVRIICFFQVAGGKAKDAPIVGSLPFLK